MAEGAAAIIGAVIAAGSATYGIASSESAKADQEQRLAEQKKKEESLLADAKTEQTNKRMAEDNQNQRAALRDKNRTLSRATLASNQGGTILTSPLGDTSVAPTRAKTLLGA